MPRACATHQRIFATLLAVAAMPAPGAAARQNTEEIVVTAARERVPSLELIGNTARLSNERIQLTNHQHIYELGVAAAGTWLSRGNGQENLTAIRSPVLTGPGACGAFLILEDGIPIRPTGFCNVNGLLEVPTELAQAVEVVRGPSNALYGSNGLHGTINVLLPEPGRAPGLNGSASAGPDDYRRGKLRWDAAVGSTKLNFGVLADHYGGDREASGYTQQKAYAGLVTHLNGGDLHWSLSVQNLDQDTAGFIFGEDAYKDPAERGTNLNPGAFRKADSQRLSVRWQPTGGQAQPRPELRLYLRRSDMEFLQHFLPGQPSEENGQISGGMMAAWRIPWRSGTFTTGVDAEFMDGFIRQYQAEALESDSAFLNETLPQGWQYDFDVRSLVVAPYAQADAQLGARWRLLAGVRFEYLRYDYDNALLDGNTRDDGTPCGFGGCRYNRPADRNDDFSNFAPNVGVSYRANQNTLIFATLSRGFRAPQATELYRLQNEQTVADLDSVILDSLEAGLRWQSGAYRLEAVGFAMLKRNDIFQDADRNNISDGRSKHIGVEMQFAGSLDSGLYAELAATLAWHKYDFDRVTQGDIVASGNDIDTAPRVLGSLRIGWSGSRARVELEGVHIGPYWLDASNEHRYDGHRLLNGRAVWRITEAWSITGRVNNIADIDYADRADFAFGEYRYLPGRPREFLVEIGYRGL